MAVKDCARWHAIEPATRRDLEDLAASHPGDLAFTSRSIDGRKVTVYYERDAASGEFALFDRASQVVNWCPG